MKVAHLISGGDVGGAKTHVHSLLGGLTGTPDVEVLLVCFMEGPFAEEARALGIPTRVLSGDNLIRTFRKLKQIVVSEGCDLIHCHGARGNLMGVLLKRALKRPTVTTVHSDYRLDYLDRPLSRLVYGTINTIAIRCMDYRIGVSDAMTDLLITRGFPLDRLFTIYNGLDFSPRTPALSRADYCKSIGLPVDGESVIVGIAARFHPVKDVATLIRGFAIAYRSCPHLRLIIAGDGEEGPKLKALARELDLGDSVCFPGWVSDTDSFYHALDINTLTSLSESFPYSLTEGARAALPTVASRVGGVPYLIDHGINGFLFDAGDAEALARCLSTLAEDPELRRRMGQKLYEKGRQSFSLESTLARQREIYQTILRRARRTGKRDGVLVCGSYGRGNAGDDAILQAIVSELAQLDPDMPVWVLSRLPRSTRLAYRVNAIHTFAFWRFLRRMKKSVLYINGGGSLIQDVTSRRSLLYYLYTLRAARRRGCRVLMYGCGIGPVSRPGDIRIARWVLNRYVDAITLREPDSWEELRAMGVTEPEIHLAADPALTLPAAPEEQIDSVLRACQIPPEGQYICFALRSWPGLKEKLPAIRAAAIHASRDLGLTPVFLAVEKHQDPDIARLAAQDLEVPHYVIADPGAPAIITGLLARMRVVVSMRLHALIFAASQGVPLVGIVYDPKVSAFLHYMEQELYLDLAALDTRRLCEMIDRAAAQRRSLEQVERLRAKEHVNQEVAARLLGLTGA